MYIISKTIKGYEYMYNRKFTIKCTSKKQALALASFLNEHNETSEGIFKLKDNEVWHEYLMADYEIPPRYKVKTTKGKISVVLNNY